MDKKEILKKITVAVETLNMVSVAGYENRRLMLGAEQTLRLLIAELEAPEEVKTNGKSAKAE